MQDKKHHSTALVFGVFDGLHEGHHYFLDQATKKAEKLIAVVTPDEIVMILKKRAPKYSYVERVAKINEAYPDLHTIPGDSALGTWDVLKTHKPDIVFLGHDQHGIATELEKLGVPFMFLGAFEPEKYKSSLLN